MTVKQEGEVGVGDSRKSSKGKKKRRIVKLESLKQLNLNAGGLDIGAAEIYAAVPEGRDEVSVRRFETFTADLNSLADWLEACGVDTVAMESTSVYWIPIYEILEKRGFDLYLVNARQVKNVTGRPDSPHRAQFALPMEDFYCIVRDEMAIYTPDFRRCSIITYFL